MGDQNTTEIFQQLSSIEQIVARIDERTKNLDERTKAHDAMHNDHECRIRELEAKEARRGGITAAITTIGSAVGAGLMWLIQCLVGKGGN
ncbi:MAG: hypothetical protein K6G91_02050 [Kiritimatiellae bacterium]|nr:hypothetical protein [Kiritimatiellia bacterium]